MSQANFDNNEANYGSYYIVTQVTNEQGEVQYVTSEEEVVGEIQDAGGYQNFDADTVNYFQAVNFLPGSYSELPQEDGIIFQAGENVERTSEVEEEDFESALKPNIIGGNIELTKEINMPFVSHQEGRFTCLLCDIGNTVCGEAKAIIAHVRETHNQRLHICDVCGEHFRKRPELSTHMNAHIATDEGEFQCEVCNRIYCNLRMFRIHKRKHNPQNKAWGCNICNKKFASKNLLQEHYNAHIGVRPYPCTTCGKNFSSKYTLKSHQNTHLDRPRPFKCTHCESSFLSQQNLTQHLRVHSGVKEYSCRVCSKKFSTVHNLEVHSVVHTGYKPYACTICNKAFARKAEIRDHERTHTGERPFQCDICGKSFGQRSNLQSHKRATHFDDKRHKCEECGKLYKRRRLLNYHMKAAHTGERPYKCDQCEATFVYPEHFKKHKNTHSGVRPYPCGICNKNFNSRDNRNSHLFVHSEKKPYECVKCGSGFMRKPHLFQHMNEKSHWSDTIAINQLRLNIDEDSNDGIQEYTIVTTLHTIAKTEEYSTLGNPENNISEGNEVFTDDKGFITFNQDQIVDINDNQLIANVQIEYVEGGENQFGEGYSLGSTEGFIENITSEILEDGSSGQPYYFEVQLPTEEWTQANNSAQ